MATGNDSRAKVLVLDADRKHAAELSHRLKFLDYDPIIVDSTDPNGATVTFVVPAFTQCGAPVPVVCVPESGSLFPPGDTVVTCTATTEFGQVNTCQFVVTVRNLGISFGPQPGTVQVDWTGGGTLQSASDPAGPWTDLGGVTSPYVTPADQPGLFFRVKY